MKKIMTFLSVILSALLIMPFSACDKANDDVLGLDKEMEYNIYYDNSVSPCIYIPVITSNKHESVTLKEIKTANKASFEILSSELQPNTLWITPSFTYRDFNVTIFVIRLKPNVDNEIIINSIVLTINNTDYDYPFKIHLINVTEDTAKTLSIASSNVYTTMPVNSYDGRAEVYFQDCVRFKENITLKSIEIEGNYTPQNESFYIGNLQINDVSALNSLSLDVPKDESIDLASMAVNLNEAAQIINPLSYKFTYVKTAEPNKEYVYHTLTYFDCGNDVSLKHYIDSHI